MLIIYSSLRIGGIETFYMRMAKARFIAGKKTKILLTSKKELSDPFLLEETKKYAEIYFLDDFLKFRLLSKVSLHFILLQPLLYKELKHLFENIKQVHVSSAIYGFFYLKISRVLKVNIPLTVGVYHGQEFIWGEPSSLPFYEKANRALFLKLLKQKNVYFFNDKLPQQYAEVFPVDVGSLNSFPLGVIESTSTDIEKQEVKSSIKIISVGRLISFKAYNLWMIDVVNELSSKFSIEYNIYGSGPLEAEIKAKIDKYGLAESVFLRGDIPYSEFKRVVAMHDLFVGSGTAIIEASSLGVSSIIGIESVKEAVSYGFICDMKGFSYNEDGLFEKYKVTDLISNYFDLSDEDIVGRRKQHIEWSRQFSMQVCVENFEKFGALSKPINFDMYNSLPFYFKYSLSFSFFSLRCKLTGKNFDSLVYG